MPKYYETALVIDPRLEEEGISKRVQLYTDLLKENGAFELRFDRRGMRKLAYDIKGKDGDWRTQGHYTFIMYQAPPEAIAPVESRLRLDEDLLRYMTIRHDKLPPTAAAPEEARAEAAGATDAEVATSEPETVEAPAEQAAAEPAAPEPDSENEEE